MHFYFRYFFMHGSTVSQLQRKVDQDLSPNNSMMNLTTSLPYGQLSNSRIFFWGDKSQIRVYSGLMLICLFTSSMCLFTSRMCLFTSSMCLFTSSMCLFTSICVCLHLVCVCLRSSMCLLFAGTIKRSIWNSRENLWVELEDIVTSNIENSTKNDHCVVSCRYYDLCSNLLDLKWSNYGLTDLIMGIVWKESSSISRVWLIKFDWLDLDVVSLPCS